jgi:hypothetical protein
VSDDGLFRDEGEGTYSLVMPFLPVTSKGGPFDDQSYVAGYEMGRVDVLLSAAANLGLAPDTHLLINAENAAQVDLVAMRYGFHCEIRDSTAEGWAEAHLTPIVPTEEEDDE